MGALRAAEADAVVLDVGLPDADGPDVCQALRARGSDAARPGPSAGAPPEIVERIPAPPRADRLTGQPALRRDARSRRRRPAMPTVKG